jgi:hypothetical protein
VVEVYGQQGQLAEENSKRSRLKQLPGTAAAVITQDLLLMEREVTHQQQEQELLQGDASNRSGRGRSSENVCGGWDEGQLGEAQQ